MAMADRLDEQLPGIAIDSNAYGPSEAALYVYGQRHDGDSSTGVVCEVGIQAFLDGRVRGHEAVQPERVEALIRRRVTTAGPPALVTLLHRAGPAFTQTLEAVGRTEPILDFDGPRGVRQTVWRLVDGPTTVALTRELGATDLYTIESRPRSRSRGSPESEPDCCVSSTRCTVSGSRPSTAA